MPKKTNKINLTSRARNLSKPYRKANETKRQVLNLTPEPNTKWEKTESKEKAAHPYCFSKHRHSCSGLTQSTLTNTPALRRTNTLYVSHTQIFSAQSLSLVDASAIAIHRVA